MMNRGRWRKAGLGWRTRGRTVLVWWPANVVGGRRGDSRPGFRLYMLKTSTLTCEVARVSKDTERTSFANPGEVRQTCSCT